MDETREASRYALARKFVRRVIELSNRGQNSSVVSTIEGRMRSLILERRWSDLVALVACWSQGLYFFVLGLWPLADIRSFQAVTGEKTDHLKTGSEADHWLVNTVALLIVVIGLVLLVAAWRRRISAEIVLLGITSAGALATIDVVYSLRQTISPIYLMDAAPEVVFIAGWIVSTLGRERDRRS